MKSDVDGEVSWRFPKNLGKLLRKRHEATRSWKELRQLAVIQFVILLSLSLFLLVISDRIQPAGMAVNRYLSRLQAPLTATFYDAKARDQISILLYESAMLKRESLAWPISYSEHAVWLQKAAGDGDPKLRPKALFVDITFGQERNDATVSELRDALCRIQVDWMVPVFLAALPDTQSGELRVRSGLHGAQRNGRPCFTLVGVDHEPDPIDGFAWTYRLTMGGHQEGHESAGHASREQTNEELSVGVNPPGYRSAALAMAQDAGKFNINVSPDPLALVWGIASAEPISDINDESRGHCRLGTADKLSKWFAPFTAIFKDGKPRKICAYHRALSIGSLNEMSEQTLATALRGKYVLVGAKVPGYNDWVDTPIHGSIPGIHAHAMALDNLLTFGDDYKLSRGWGEIFEHAGDRNFFALLLSASFCVFVVVMVDLLRVPLLAKLKKLIPGRQHSLQGAVAHTWLGVASEVLKWSSFWAFRLLIKILIVTAAIQILSTTFRVGMLPVMELIGMVILWESIEVMGKIEDFLSEGNA